MGQVKQCIDINIDARWRIRTKIKPPTGRINVKVYERLERSDTTKKWDRDVQKWEVKRKRNSGFKVGM